MFFCIFLYNGPNTIVILANGFIHYITVACAVLCNSTIQIWADTSLFVLKETCLCHFTDVYPDISEQSSV